MPDTGKGTHVSSQQEAAVIMAYLRSKSSGNRVKASVGSKTRSSDPLFRLINRMWRRGRIWHILFFTKINNTKVNICIDFILSMHILLITDR